MHDFFRRHNRKQRKLAAGIAIKPKGRPRKDGAQLPPSVQQLSRLTQLQYELAGKERYIKRLEMENELITVQEADSLKRPGADGRFAAPAGGQPLPRRQRKGLFGPPVA